MMARWDGVWYVAVARDGYPNRILEGVGNGAQSNLGFFPVFPLLMRAVQAVTPFGLIVSGVIVSTSAERQHSWSCGSSSVASPMRERRHAR